VWEEELFQRWKLSLAYPQTLDFGSMSLKEIEAFTELGAAWEHFKATAVAKSLGG